MCITKTSYNAFEQALCVNASRAWLKQVLFHPAWVMALPAPLRKRIVLPITSAEKNSHHEWLLHCAYHQQALSAQLDRKHTRVYASGLWLSFMAHSYDAHSHHLSGQRFAGFIPYQGGDDYRRLSVFLHSSSGTDNDQLHS